MAKEKIKVTTEVISTDGAQALAYAVIKSAIKARDRYFFESGVYRFYMELLDFGVMYDIHPVIKQLATSKGWKLPSYPMNVKKESA